MADVDEPGRHLAETKDATKKKPKHKFCNTTMYGLNGDYAYESCGGFCKEAKKQNHCRFCKCARAPPASISLFGAHSRALACELSRCRTCSFCTGVTTLLKLREKKQGGGKLKKLTLPSTPTDIEKQIDSIEATIKKRKRRANRKEVKVNLANRV